MITIKVLLAGHDPIVRGGLQRLLEAAPDIVVGGEAASTREALTRGRAEPWDLIMLDLSRPEDDGLDFLRLLKRDGQTCPVLIFTMHPDRQLATRLIHAGAAGILGKGSSAASIVDAVRRAAAGLPSVSDLASGALVPGPDVDQPPHAKLSDREFQVMLRLASGRRPHEIARDLGLSAKTVSTYRARVLEKLHLGTNAELAAYAMRNDLIT
jgi:two-component system invasion response regulator UvrY